jgi:CubicO group peptidase (beta-lactamase class C family)
MSDPMTKVFDRGLRALALDRLGPRCAGIPLWQARGRPVGVAWTGMRRSFGVVRNWQLVRVEGDAAVMNAASLVKQVIAHLALELIEDLDESVSGDITVRHVLTHTTGLPNWRPQGQPLEPLRPPGLCWGYSGEGFVLLQEHLQRRTGVPITRLASDRVFASLGMNESCLGDPEPGFHGYRPLLTTAADYGRFLAHVLRLDDARWEPLWRIDSELAWGAGWGIELGPPLHGWQWGLNDDASNFVNNFVIGCPSTGDGVVVLTDDPDGRSYYRAVVQSELPGDHAALRVEQNRTWLEMFI